VTVRVTGPATPGQGWRDRPFRAPVAPRPNLNPIAYEPPPAPHFALLFVPRSVALLMALLMALSVALSVPCGPSQRDSRHSMTR
jgi:hypothetical protein